MDGPFASPNGRNTMIGRRANAVVSSMALCSGGMVDETREVWIAGRGTRTGLREEESHPVVYLSRTSLLRWRNPGLTQWSVTGGHCMCDNPLSDSRSKMGRRQ
jgi:hypothetical protein